MAYGSNPWDNSSIILANQSGANIGQGIEQAARAFGKGVDSYFERKKQQEKEDATVEWLNQNEGAVHQLFPQLAEVKDPIERKKVIKAGIKGAGLENLVQVRQFMDQQKRQAEQAKIQQEMAPVLLQQQKLQNEQMQGMMADRAAESAAMKAAADPQAAMKDQIMRGARFDQLDPNAQPDRSALYMRAGGKNPAMIQAMMKEQQFVPSAVDLPGGGRMLMTSRGSAVPDPSMRQKSKAPASANGPEYSKDGKFYRDGPDGKWTPIKGKGETLDAVGKAELSALPEEIADLEKQISAAAGETRKGNKKPGPDWLPGADTYDEKIQKLQTALNEKRKRLQQLSGGGLGSADAPTKDTGARQPVGDPFSYVLGS